MSSTPYDQVIIDIKNYVFDYHIGDEDVFNCARMALLDAMGCAIETISSSAECGKLLGPFDSITVNRNGFRLPGTSYLLDPLKGAFDMATIIRYLDHNDAIAGADWGHPSDNLGAILAVADWQSHRIARGDIVHTGPKLTMRTLLTAMIKAYEIQGCFLLRNAFNKHGLDHVILVKLASTAVVAWLLGLTEEETMAAISHVWMDGHPLRTYRHGTNTIPRKGWAAGDACMRAVQLVLFAQTGQPGSKTVLTEPRWGFYDTLFGGQPFQFPIPYDSWVIRNTIFKVMPVEGHGIAAVQAALQHGNLMRAQGLSPDKHIKRVDIRTTAAAILIIDKQGHLHNAADRDHCMQYMVALALLKGAAPESNDYKSESPWACDERLSELRSNIHLTEDKNLTKDYLDLDKKSLASGVTITFTDDTISEEIFVEFPVGHVQSADTKKMVQEKFIKNMKLQFSTQEIERVIKAVEMPDLMISEFLGLFAKGRHNIQKL
ncbi:hypothetical protein COCMIDRAFT_107996 [Bipolaris oryzae ATCC 44560]|uniref:2-methylcitrate dehydratase n=1 Tax=Bipolaris oryzae ATCC 44560 TaxID=930090 RepID=W6YYY4_COCMI|nr:uncharacterized protein COCMIDRAFT_107996 [Bipolaris oryzae ATCC 44560]EUC40739.1 hypothetical protein COCMIDRAFT_107996 [Bipolaris oryzae ATCC 44560]